MLKRMFAVCAASSVLAGCISSGGADVVKPIASDLSTSAHVTEVVLTKLPEGENETFATVFKAEIVKHLETCAKGQKPLKLEITINEYKRANTAAAMLVGSANRINLKAQLVDADKQVVADFDIHRSVGGGGLIPTLAMSNSAGQMGDAVGDEICKQAFLHR